MKVKANTQTDSMVDNKEIRQKYIDRVEILDKVKTLFLIPQLDMMTIQQVADFYEVDLKVIQMCVLRNSDEIYADGVAMEKPRDLTKIWKTTKCSFPEVGKTANSTTYQIADNVTVVIPNRGIRCFSKRAVLYILRQESYPITLFSSFSITLSLRSITLSRKSRCCSSLSICFCK